MVGNVKIDSVKLRENGRRMERKREREIKKEVGLGTHNLLIKDSLQAQSTMSGDLRNTQL